MVSFYLEFDKKNYYVKATAHLDEYKMKNLKRGDNFNSENVTLILEEALSKGLTSFRNKGKVALIFKDINKITYGFLVELDDSNTITIITIYRDWFKENKEPFRTVKNKINLFGLEQIDFVRTGEKNLDEFVNQYQGISSGIKKVKSEKHTLKIVKKVNPKVMTIDDFQLTEEDKKDFRKCFATVKKIK